MHAQRIFDIESHRIVNSYIFGVGSFLISFHTQEKKQEQLSLVLSAMTDFPELTPPEDIQDRTLGSHRMMQRTHTHHTHMSKVIIPNW